MIRHERCKVFETQFDSLKEEYETILKRHLKSVKEGSETINKQFESIIEVFPNRLEIETKEKDQAILELQVNWNELTAEEKSNEAYKELMDTKLRELDKYIWGILMHEIQQADEKIINL